MAHARTQTIQEWSDLTRDQLVTLRRRWAITARDRRRGPSPSSFEVFFGSARARQRAALFASLCQIVGAIPSERGKRAAEKLPSLERGELLCEAFELFKEWEPAATLEFEQAVLLAVGVVEEDAVVLRHCAGCNAAILIDRLGSTRSTCSYCRQHSSARQSMESEGGRLKSSGRQSDGDEATSAAPDPGSHRDD